MRVFLSYRRTDDRHLAGRLRDVLADEFGEDNVFFDVDSITAGQDFRVAIREHIDDIDVMLALVGPRWEPSRLRVRSDFVRTELAEAFRQGIPVIPVLIDNTPMPSPDELPDELEQLAFLNALVVRPDPDFRGDAARVTRAVYAARQAAAEAGGRAQARQQEREAQADAPTVSPSVAGRGEGAFARAFRTLARRTEPTLGPDPRPVATADADSSGAGLATTDPIVVASSMLVVAEATDRLGIQRSKEMMESVRISGDGAATAMAIASSLIEEIFVDIDAGAAPAAINRGVKRAVEVALKDLAAGSRPVETTESLRASLLVAAEDANAADLVADAIDMVGKDGVVVVEESHTVGEKLEFYEGMRFNQGYISPYFVTDPERHEAILYDAFVLLVRSKILAVRDLVPLLEKVIKTGRPLVVVAEDVEGEALATLVVNNVRDTLKSVAVKAPGLGEHRKAMLQDIAVLTGGQVIDEDVGLKLENATLDLLGHARKVVVTADETIIVEGAGSEDNIKARIYQIRDEVQNSEESLAQIKLQERLAKLAGGVAIVMVGASSETALRARTTLIERTMRAARSLIEGGVIAGGGAALVRAAKPVLALALETAEADEAAGIRAVGNALSAPARCLAHNAGYDADELIAELASGSGERVFDLRAGGYADSGPSGVLDGLSSVSAAIREAAALATFAAVLAE